MSKDLFLEVRAAEQEQTPRLLPTEYLILYPYDTARKENVPNKPIRDN